MDVLLQRTQRQRRSHLDGCLNAFGNSTTGLGEDAEGNEIQVPLYGCPDTDGDGRANQDDAFPLEPTQTTDSDGDGFGDNIGGVDGDECYLVPGVAEGTPTLRAGPVEDVPCSTTLTATAWVTTTTNARTPMLEQPWMLLAAP